VRGERNEEDTGMDRIQFIIIAALACGLALPGCRPRSQPQPPAEPTPHAAEMSTVSNRVDELHKLSEELNRLAGELPGREKSDDRRMLAETLDRTQSALALLMGPEPHGAFRQQLRILDNVRRDVRSGSASDATIDSGLRSVYNALVGIRQRLFATDDRVRGQLDTLRQRVDDLDSVRGPLHSVNVASVMQSAAEVIATMTAALEGRLNQQDSAPAMQEQS
jgi:hypothetical protein